jgi:large subunit ribosomal protein L2
MIIKDSLCSSNISLLCFKNGFLMYNLAIFKLVEQDIIINILKNIKYNIGDRLPLKYIRTGTLINNVEILPGCGGKLLRAAGSFGKI